MDRICWTPTKQHWSKQLYVETSIFPKCSNHRLGAEQPAAMVPASRTVARWSSSRHSAALALGSFWLAWRLATAGNLIELKLWSEKKQDLLEGWWECHHSGYLLRYMILTWVGVGTLYPSVWLCFCLLLPLFALAYLFFNRLQPRIKKNETALQGWMCSWMWCRSCQGDMLDGMRALFHWAGECLKTPHHRRWQHVYIISHFVAW